MKKTDYAPRAADFDTYLVGHNLVGIEVGVDVGAHAEALLTYCNIRSLYLVDVWQREFYRGYCEGRLYAKGFMHNVKMMQMGSMDAMLSFTSAHIEQYFDFMYFDQLHDYKSVKEDLTHWWPMLKPGGILGYRNYAESNKDLKRAVDEFIAKIKCKSVIERGEIVLFKDK